MRPMACIFLILIVSSFTSDYVVTSANFVRTAASSPRHGSETLSPPQNPKSKAAKEFKISVRRTEQDLLSRATASEAQGGDWEEEGEDSDLQQNQDQEGHDGKKNNEDLWIKYASRREKSKHMAIGYTVSGTISLISCIVLFTVILRSYTGLGSTYHRLLFGLGVSNALASISYSMNSLLAPSDVSYMVWNASGNNASCRFSGFSSVTGVCAGIMYNWALCFFYLAVVRYEGTDKFVRTRLEPYFHGVAIVYPLVWAVILLALDAYYPYNVICRVETYNPPHCEGFDKGDIPPGYTIPCGSGRPINYFLYYLIHSLPVDCMTPVVFIVTMTMCYRKVLQNEKTSQKYGANSIRQKIAIANGRTSVLQAGMKGNDERREDWDLECGNSRRGSIMSSFRTSIAGIRTSLSMKIGTSFRRSSVTLKYDTQKSRLIFYRAVSYVMAFVVCYGILIILMVLRLARVSLGEETMHRLSVTHSVLGPLQGFFNLLIFLHPKILSQKRSKKKNLSWTGAFVEAVKSRGVKPRKRWSGAKTKPPVTALSSSKKVSFRETRSGRKVSQRNSKMHEEEKCAKAAKARPSILENVSRMRDPGSNSSSITFQTNFKTLRESALRKKNHLRSSNTSVKELSILSSSRRKSGRETLNRDRACQKTSKRHEEEKCEETGLVAKGRPCDAFKKDDRMRAPGSTSSDNSTSNYETRLESFSFSSPVQEVFLPDMLGASSSFAQETEKSLG